MTKKELRAEIRSRLSGLSDCYKKESSKKISELALSCDEYKSAKSIFVYISTVNEPDTGDIINDALQTGKTVYVPKCIEKGVMVPVLINEDTEFSDGYMGIREPLYYDENISLAEIDLCVIPCMSVSVKGERLGHGAGFYDIFLSKTKTCKLCLCFSELLCDDIPTDEYDIKMDCVITENGIYFTE